MSHLPSVAVFFIVILLAGSSSATNSTLTTEGQQSGADQQRPAVASQLRTPRQNAVETPGSEQDKLDQRKSAIQLRLSASRQNAAMGSALAIKAEITNVSGQDVFLNPLFMPLVIPPEVDPKSPRAWFPLVPPCDPDREPTDKGITKKGAERYDCIARLSPGSHLIAVWQANKPALKGDPEDSWWKRRGIEFGFTPGIYPFPVVVNYWDDRLKAEQKDLRAARIETAEILLPLSAPLNAIIIGAGLGGMIASFLGFVVRRRRAAADTFNLWTAAQDFIRPGVMGVIVAVAIQRLAGASFPISVTVNDFLGAICIGFIGGASGESFLRRRIAPGAPSPDAPETEKEKTRPAEALQAGAK